MKTRTALKVARLKKAPNKGRWGSRRSFESFESTIYALEWEAPVGDSRSSRQLIVAVAFMVPLVLFIVAILAAIFGG